MWDGGAVVRASCTWDAALRVATNIASVDIDGLESLDREYAELPNGEEIDVDSQAATAVGIPARPDETPQVGDVIHHLDMHSQPTTNTALISAVGACTLHGRIWMVYDGEGVSTFVRRAFGRDGLAPEGLPVWLEYYPD